MWLEVEQFDESIFVQAIVPALQALNDGHADNISRALHVSAEGAKVTNLRGVRTVQNLQKWAAPELKSAWLNNLALMTSPETNLTIPLTKSVKKLHVLACDLKHLPQVQHMLESDNNVLVVSNGIKNADARRRSLALALCQSCIRENSYAHVHRIASANDLAIACQTIDRGDTPAARFHKPLSILLWFDFTTEVSPEDVQTITKQFCTSDLQENAAAIITCVDGCDAAVYENLEDFEYEEHDIKDESGVSNVYADQLHDEFQLIASWTVRKPSDSQLDFEPEPDPEDGIVPGGTLDQQPHACLTCSIRSPL